MAWLEGPTEAEAAAGWLASDYGPISWFVESIRFRREGGTLHMDFIYWEPMNHLLDPISSSYVAAGLLGSVFSDPTVDVFCLSVVDSDPCEGWPGYPGFAGYESFAGPLTWEDFITVHNTDWDLTGIPDPVCENLPEKLDPNATPGVFLLCDWVESRGRVFPREGVTTAEEAVMAWTVGPTREELIAGWVGMSFVGVPWFAESIRFHREGGTLYMDFVHYEPINNLSTSTGSSIYMDTLLGTVFSDPTVDAFCVSLLYEDSMPCTAWPGDIDYETFAEPLRREDLLTN